MKSLENIKKELETLKNRKLSEIESKELKDQHNQIISIMEEVREISDEMYVEFRFRHLGNTDRSNFEVFKILELEELYKPTG